MGQSKRDRRTLSDEFKRAAVELVRTSGRPVAVIAGELGIYDSCWATGVKQDRVDRGGGKWLTSDERGRLRELEAENARLRMERDLLERSVAFWVTETSTTVNRYRCVVDQSAARFPATSDDNLERGADLPGLLHRVPPAGRPPGTSPSKRQARRSSGPKHAVVTHRRSDR